MARHQHLFRLVATPFERRTNQSTKTLQFAFDLYVPPPVNSSFVVVSKFQTGKTRLIRGTAGLTRISLWTWWAVMCGFVQVSIDSVSAVLAE
eukprot:255637-Pyramimonas_sp.AAC.1